MIVATKGSIDVTARGDAIWAALHDVERLALCVPGCREVIHRGGNVYAVAACVRFGPIRIAFDGVVEITDFEAPARLVLAGRGHGGLAGAASGTATIRVVERPDGCRLSYEMDVRPRGPIARLGPTLLTGLAVTLSEKFACRFAELFEAQALERRSSRWRTKALGRPTAA